jgi:hypothetical protein
VDIKISVVDGGWPKMDHIKTPLRPMEPLWWVFLHKLPMWLSENLPWQRHLITLIKMPKDAYMIPLY